MKIGAAIMQIRKDNGLSQEAFGESLGVSRQAISKWESDSSLPEIEKLLQISEMYNVSVNKILGVEATDNVDDKLSDAQVQLAQEIAKKYLDALPHPTEQKPLPRWVPVCAAMLVVSMLIACLSLGARVRSLSENNTNLQAQIANINRLIGSEFDNLSGMIDDSLNKQNSVLSAADAEIVCANLSAGTVDIAVSLVPKTYTNGMGVTITAKSEGKTFTATAVEGDGQRFAATVTCTLSDEIILSVVLNREEKSENQTIATIRDELAASVVWYYPELNMLWREAVSVDEKAIQFTAEPSEYGNEIDYHGQTVTAKEIGFSVDVNGKEVFFRNAAKNDAGVWSVNIPIAELSLKNNDIVRFVCVVLDCYGRKYRSHCYPDYLIVNGIFKDAGRTDEIKEHLQLETSVDSLTSQ